MPPFPALVVGDEVFKSMRHSARRRKSRRKAMLFATTCLPDSKHKGLIESIKRSHDAGRSSRGL